jgi:Protein of unknown function (DUF4199)
MKELFIKMSQIAATVALVTGVFYGLANYTLHINGMDFSNLQIWTFRLSVVAAVTWSMLIFRKRNGFLMSIRQGLAVGMLASLFIGAAIALNTFVMREYINPNYNEGLKNIIRGNLSREINPEDSSQLKWKPEQIEVQLNQRWATFFTTKGGMAIDVFGALAVGFLTSATVSFMSRRVKKEN